LPARRTPFSMASSKLFFEALVISVTLATLINGHRSFADNIEFVLSSLSRFGDAAIAAVLD
jgi:hypothetical protein